MPQSLPLVGRSRRRADELADTPTRRLPASRSELENWKLYKGLIEAGVEIFWSAHTRRLGRVLGLEGGAGPLLIETYPRYVIKRLWPELRIPSKRKEGVRYASTIWERIKSLGYRCESVRTPTVDQVDAALCALAAEFHVGSEDPEAGAIGDPPLIDQQDGVIREGYIVSP